VLHLRCCLIANQFVGEILRGLKIVSVIVSYMQVFLRCFRDLIRIPRIKNWVPRIRENYHRVPRIKENWVPTIR